MGMTLNDGDDDEVCSGDEVVVSSKLRKVFKSQPANSDLPSSRTGIRNTKHFVFILLCCFSVCFLSFVFYLLSFVFCLLSFVFCLLSFVFCLLSFVFCLSSFVFCLSSFVFRLLSFVFRLSSFVSCPLSFV